MRRRISIRGCVRPSVHPSVRQSVRPSVRLSVPSYFQTRTRRILCRVSGLVVTVVVISLLVCRSSLSPYLSGRSSPHMIEKTGKKTNGSKITSEGESTLPERAPCCPAALPAFALPPCRPGSHRFISRQNPFSGKAESNDED